MPEEKIKINGVETNYKVTGQGEPFLILHGWGSNAERWDEVGEALAQKGLSIIVPDLPGFGKSQAPLSTWGLDEYLYFVKEFTNLLGLKNFYLAGHSFGGAVAAKYALKFPNDVKRLVLVASACIRKKTLKKVFFVGVSKALKVFSFLPFYAFFRKGFYRFIVRKSDYANLNGVMKDSYLKIINDDLTETLPFIGVPTIIIWGKKDDITPISDAYLINRMIKNSRLVIIPEGSHDLERKIPAVLAEKIIENLK